MVRRLPPLSPRQRRPAIRSWPRHSASASCARRWTWPLSQPDHSDRPQLVPLSVLG